MMRVNLFLTLFGVIASAFFVSACGTSKRQNLFEATLKTNQIVIPALEPPPNYTSVSDDLASSPTSVSTDSVTIAAVPGQRVSIGQTVTLIASGAPSYMGYSFQFQSNSIGARFVRNSEGGSYIGVTSSVPGSVTISAKANQLLPLVICNHLSEPCYGGSIAPAQITITFDGNHSAINHPGTYSSCSIIKGPFGISGSSRPRVGDSYYFLVQNHSSGHYGYTDRLKIINVWTPDSSEIGRYYYAWDKFWMTFNSSGQKTINVRTQSQITGKICEAQISIFVAGEPSVNPSPEPVLVEKGIIGTWQDNTRCAIRLTLTTDEKYTLGSSTGCVGGSEQGTFSVLTIDFPVFRQSIRFVGINPSTYPGLNHKVEYGCAYRVTDQQLELYNCSDGISRTFTRR